MTLLEILGAFALFILIVLIVLWSAGIAKFSCEIVKDEDQS